MNDSPSITAVDEPAEGNLFVAAYPPFSSWTEGETGAFRDALDAPAPAAAPDGGLGLYVHFPFCERRCRYCYYLSWAGRTDRIEPYVEALDRELALYARRPAIRDRRPTFVYFGGGTPSLLTAEAIRRLTSRLRASLPWTGVREVTFECAPRSVTREKVAVLRDAGVTRISLGVQQLDDRLLAGNQRVHRVRDVELAWEAIRQADFPVVNVDLMVGLPGETDEGADRSVERVVAMAPDSVTVYQLEMPLNTPLYRRWSDGTLEAPVPSWAAKRDRLRRAFARLEAAGYVVRSAYAAVRDPRRHRFVYQEDQYRGADLVGIGASAFSYVGGVHQQNLTGLDAWLNALARGELPLWRAHALRDDERLTRELVLQLKLGRVDLVALGGKFGVDVAARFAGPLRACERRGWLTLDPGEIALTREGLLRADRMLSLFYLPEHRDLRYS